MLHAVAADPASSTAVDWSGVDGWSSCPPTYLYRQSNSDNRQTKGVYVCTIGLCCVHNCPYHCMYVHSRFTRPRRYSYEQQRLRAAAAALADADADAPADAVPCSQSHRQRHHRRTVAVKVVATAVVTAAPPPAAPPAAVASDPPGHVSTLRLTLRLRGGSMLTIS